MEEITAFLLIRLVRLQVGIIAFIGLFSLDLWKAWTSKAHWVPQGALVLSALSLQLLALLDPDNVSIADYPVNKEYDLIKVFKNELLIDGGRVVVCVYMGYLVPVMARSASESGRWGDIGALAISLSTHIFSELYVFTEMYSKLWEENIPINPLSIVSRVCTVVCAVLLFCILSAATFAGRTLKNLVQEKIPLIERQEPEHEDDYDMKYVVDDVFKSWAVTWVCRPDYIIVRSVLASSVGTIVTVAVGCFAAEWTTQDYKVLHFGDGIDWFRYIVTAFMVLLILIGWSIVFFRWMFAIFYFPGKYQTGTGKQGYFNMEDFWTRHIFQVLDDIEFSRPSWDRNVSGQAFFDSMKLRVLRALKVHELLRNPLLRSHRIVIVFSKLCCILSENIFFVHLFRSCIVRNLAREYNETGEFDDLQKPFEFLVMPGETGESLLAGSLKSLKDIKNFGDKGRREGMKSTRLIQFLRQYTHSRDQNVECQRTAGQNTQGEITQVQSSGGESIEGQTTGDQTSEGESTESQNTEGRQFLEDLGKRLEKGKPFDYLTKLSWKMTALSLIQVMIKMESGEAGDALDAYSEAYDFLELLDNPVGTAKHFSPEFYVRAADKKFKNIKQQLDRNSGPSPGEGEQKVRDLQEETKRFLPGCSGEDSVDWWAVAADYSLYEVCEIVLRPAQGSDNRQGSETAHYTDLKVKVRKILADIIVIALKEKVKRQLVYSCREWAELLEDEKIKASVYIAGKLSGVLKELEGNTLPEPTDGNVDVRGWVEKIRASVNIAGKLKKIVGKLKKSNVNQEATHGDMGVGNVNTFSIGP